MQSPKLFKIISDEIGSLPASDADQSKPDISQETIAKHTPYMASAILETLRIFATVLSARVAVKDTTLTAGSPPVTVHLKKGSRVIAPTRTLAIDPATWGEDAKVWKGDRFYGEEGRKKARDMAPYGGGSSVCSGRHFASVELASTTIIFLSAFHFNIAGAKVVAEDGEEGEEYFDIIDVDGARLKGKWPGARADPRAVQSGVFRAGAQMSVKLTPRY